MPNPSLTLWIDSATSRLLSGWQSVSSATAPILKQGDSIGVEVHWVSNYQGGSMSEVAFPPSVAMTLAIGNIDEAPTAGTFKLAYGANTTAEIAYSATALQVQTALNALASITADGGVTVTKISTTYRVVWNVAMIPSSTLSVASNELFPSSSIGVNNAKTGTVSVKQTYQIHIKQAPVANITSFVDQSPSEATISVIHTRGFVGDSAVWRVSIKPEPRDGTFLLLFSAAGIAKVSNPISIDSSSADMVATLSNVYDAGWACIKTGKYSWDISTSDTAVTNFEINDNGLISFNSKYGVLNLNTAEVEDLLAGATSASTYMELELASDGTRQTLFQSQVTILNDLIDNDSYTTVAWGELMPADSVVRYDTSQNLSVSQKLQARDNIGAIDVGYIQLLNNTYGVLFAQVAALEALQLSSNQKAALNAASTLSVSDPVLAESSINTLLLGKTDVGHEHIIGDINDLQTALDLKADSGHTHTISQITDFDAGLFATQQDLTDAIETRSPTGHTHTSFTNLGLGGTLTVPYIESVQTLSFTDGTSITTAPFSFEDAPNDGNAYLRQNGNWVLVNIVTETINGTVYNILTV